MDYRGLELQNSNEIILPKMNCFDMKSGAFIGQ